MILDFNQCSRFVSEQRSGEGFGVLRFTNPGIPRPVPVPLGYYPDPRSVHTLNPTPTKPREYGGRGRWVGLTGPHHFDLFPRNSRTL